MTRGRTLVFLGILCALVALPATAASARVAFYTGAEEGSYASSIDLTTELEGNYFPFVGEGAPPGVAIAPDGSTAYVIGETYEPSLGFVGIVLPIDVATDTEKTAIRVGVGPRGIAIAPDGKTAYVTNAFDETVSPVDLATGTAGTPIPVPGEAFGVAITPDGKTAYVSLRDKEQVVPIDIATGTVGTPIPVGEVPSGLAVAPDGGGVYVVNRVSESISRIDPATNTVTGTIPLGASNAEWIAVTPDSLRAYVSAGNSVVPVDLAGGTAGTPISVASQFLGQIAILPDGSRAYAANESAGELLPIEIPANTVGTGVQTGPFPLALAIVPNQPPRASFTVSPAQTTPGSTVSFDATASADTDGGSVARYDWDFGDGTTLANGGPTPTHVFPKEPKEGAYTVTLTTTDNEGCSVTKVFPGQTMYCNGSSIARTTRQVAIKVNCPTATASATSFVPKFRSSHVVPGVRVRLAASDPSRLDVEATLEWKGGHKVALAPRSVDVEHWRRIRYPIPGKARNELPLGSKVTLKLKIVATPLVSTACSGSTVEKTLRLRVVKVIPGAEQHGRRK